ncbi:transporter substrate-binding domain-containing protein [Caballeronia humi]|uniref:Extracellular solute-binding protein n=1 Tax=Caballeronia humi TaxID=326474 RepID=A0A158J5T9_9BURK|nr:transporter substrate-binding domain-containing protein [Caballeronia humi]SAL64332.1 extracellular solute-binding protein [Caballeronia humi]
MALICRIIIRLLLLCLALLMVVDLTAQAARGDTLAQARSRGFLRCGVSEGFAGFSVRDATGHWSGMDVDFCRALAAAVLHDSNKVVFVPLKASARFAALQMGAVDLLARNTTWTLLREGALQLQFAGVLFYDAQALMVRTQGGKRSIASLKGETVCVQKDTSTEDHLRAYSQANSLDLKPLVMDSAIELSRAFFAGRCSAYTADSSI